MGVKGTFDLIVKIIFQTFLKTCKPSFVCFFPSRSLYILAASSGVFKRGLLFNLNPGGFKLLVCITLMKAA